MVEDVPNERLIALQNGVTHRAKSSGKVEDQGQGYGLGSVQTSRETGTGGKCLS